MKSKSMIDEKQNKLLNIECLNNRRKIVNVVKLKRFALEQLPQSSILRHILSLEKDEMRVDEFLAKLDIWLALFKKENE